MGKRKRAHQIAGNEGENKGASSTQAVLGPAYGQVHELMPQVRVIPSDSVSLLTLGSQRQKRHYRQRAHVNVFSDHTLQYPASPELFDWTTHYPAPEYAGKRIEMADVGCGFGGLLTALAPIYPDTLILGESSSSFLH